MTSLGAPGNPSGTLFRLMPTGTGPEQSVRPCVAGRRQPFVGWLRWPADQLGPSFAPGLPPTAFPGGAPKCTSSRVCPGDRWQEWPEEQEQSSEPSLTFPFVLPISVTGPKVATGLHEELPLWRFSAQR